MPHHRRPARSTAFATASMIALSLSACSSTNATSTAATPTTDIATFIGFVTVDGLTADGEFNGIPVTGSTVVRSGSDGYAYAASLLNGDSFPQTVSPLGATAFAAVSGILPTTNVGTLPSFGNATMTGTYQLTHVTRSATSARPTASDFESATGTITLTSDFAAKTLSATTSATTGQPLTITEFNSTNGDLLMTSTYRDAAGVVNGKIGANRAVGAFAGNGLTGVYAGGFIVNK